MIRHFICGLSDPVMVLLLVDRGCVVDVGRVIV